MKNVMVVVLIVVALPGIGFVIYQQINIFKIELQQKAALEGLTSKYEAGKTELVNKYEAEIKNLRESNIQSSQQYEATLKR